MKKILVIQTAFIGDVILATTLLETLHLNLPDAQIDFLLRKGNESLLANHPFLNQMIIWDKKQGKYRNLLGVIAKIRQQKYDLVINLQRFFATGLIASFSKGKQIIGFDKNPLSIFFTEKIKHQIGVGRHEVERNHDLVRSFCTELAKRPQLYPSNEDYENVRKYQAQTYICLAPTSVWFTKQLPAHKWVELIQKIPQSTKIYLIGAPTDSEACESIIQKSQRKNVENLCGKLTLLMTAALMEKSTMNYVNDSAPLHIASAMNAPVTAFFCSTIPAFGFTPLSERSIIIETKEHLDCRPCNLHGFKACPKGHFNCGEGINII